MTFRPLIQIFLGHMQTFSLMFNFHQARNSQPVSHQMIGCVFIKERCVFSSDSLIASF